MARLRLNAAVTTTARRRSRRPPYLLRIVSGRPRLFSSAAVGLVVLAALPGAWGLVTRQLIAWDVGIALYLGLVYELMARADVARIRQRAAVEDEGRIGILVLTVAAALASLGAIVVELGRTTIPAASILATLTILLSWAMTHTIFALHYAHEYYSENGGKGGGLQFPGDQEPDYWDFIYFSFVIGMTSQVSDVAVASRTIRRTVTAHGIVAFVFNAALVALTVNIAGNYLLAAQ